MESIFRTLWQGGHLAPATSTWPGTSRSPRSATSPSARSRSATTRSRQLGDRDLRDLKVAGRAPKYTVTSVTDFKPCGTDGCQDGEDDRAGAARGGHVQGALLPRQARLPARLALQLRAPVGPHPDADPGQHRSTRRFICNIPRAAVDGAGREAGAAVALRPRPARRSRRGERRQRPGRCPPSTTSCSAPRRGSACPTRTSGTPWASSRTSRASRALTDRLQQGFVDFTVPRPADDPPERLQRERRLPGRGPQRDRHAPPLLRRQQPGRHLRRRAHRARARLHARGARRAGDELLDAAAPQHGLRRLLGRSSTRPTRPGRAAADPLDRADALGPQRPERLRAPHHRRPAAGHARRTRC